MLDRCNQTVLSLLFGCLVCLFVASIVNADGRVFVLDLRNSSGLQGFRDAELACSSQHARLASAEEVHHAVLECYFSPCTRGWLYGGTVGTTVCNIVGGTLKAVDVRAENATEDAAHLDAFCIRDKGVACGDPPSFPNARMQGQSEFEMGDELLYTCLPGYVMPNGQRAFSLLCDSCGEWYGLVQVCVKDETESHVDYEDKFTDSYGEAERHNEGPEEAHGEVYEEVHGAAYPEGKRAQEQQETSFSLEVEAEHQDQHGEQEEGGEVTEHDRTFVGVPEAGEKDEERAAEDFIGHPRWEQGRSEEVKTDAAAATDAPVSLLSQKHLFWFPSEAFQQEGHPVSTNPVPQTTQRASGAQSEESKEQESQERQPHQLPVDDHDHDHEQDTYDDHDTDDRDDHDNSDHDDQDVHDDSHHDDQDDPHSHQDKDDRDEDSKHYISAQDDDLDQRDHDERYDHYDMGEHEDDRHHVRYGSQDYDNRDDTYDEHEDVTDDHTDDDQEHPDSLEEHPVKSDDHDDGEEHYDPSEDDHDHKDPDDHDSYDNHDHHDHHDSHEDDDHPHVIFSIETDERQNVTQKGAGATATTDETWLDGYPVAPEETEKSDSTTERMRPEDRERGTVVRTTDRPNEVEKPVPYTSLPEVPESPTTNSDIKQGGVEEVWPGFILTTAPSPDEPETSYSDTLDYDTQQAAPTQSWLGDLTEHPFPDHGPAPPVHDGDVITGGLEEHTVHDLPGETSERDEVEGEMGETICTGEDCPPHPPSSSSRGPTVAAIIVVVCVVALAVIVGVWCYRRRQQKSSMYKMNGKGQSQTRQGQQIEMQQKV
ncbi:sushi domain-containing protein 5 [Scomber scombrus]|uniref:sushi domain-containing protein 5 n=1 Tax=Scomber scombrus TaxID=13677 RepID=UPI002DDA0BC5|nr:sushi domain-containing protein 5 [Scomber scombrus]